jgi:hypothetical protein
MMIDSIDRKTLEALWDRCERILSRIDRMEEARKRRYARMEYRLTELQDQIAMNLPVAKMEF